MTFFYSGLNASKCRIYLKGGFYDVMATLVDDISFAPHSQKDSGKMESQEDQQAVNLFSRRGFLIGKRDSAPLRPPWSVAPDTFTDLCARCDECSRACAEGIIVRGDGGFPEINFAFGECTFCGNCRNACLSGAIATRGKNGKDEAPWSLKAEIGDACLPLHGVECRICQDQCAPQAIAFDFAQDHILTPNILQDDCSGCGACFRVCPVNAISIHDTYPVTPQNGPGVTPQPYPNQGEAE